MKCCNADEEMRLDVQHIQTLDKVFMKSDSCFQSCKTVTLITLSVFQTTDVLDGHWTQSSPYLKWLCAVNWLHFS